MDDTQRHDDAPELPHDLEAERSALGAALIDPAASTRVCELLTAADFYRGQHRAIFEALLALRQDGVTPDVVTVSAALDRLGIADAAGGVAYLSELQVAVPTAFHVEHYAGIVSALAARRRVIDVAGAMVRDAYAGDGDAAGLMRSAVSDLQARLPLASDRLDWDDATLDPAREWLIPDYLPSGRVALFTGDGAAGKSRLALQLAAALASGVPGHWLPTAAALQGGELATLEPDPSAAVPVVVASYEDEPSEARRRLRRLAVGSGAPGHEGRGALPYAHHEARGGRVHYVDLAGAGPLWGPAYASHVSTRAGALPPWERVTGYAARVGARLLILDPLAAVFGGSENDRAAVREFVSALDRWGREHRCAILLIAHPPKPASGAPAPRYSGSTDWRNAARTVWTLERCTVADCGCGGGLALVVDKASYALAPAAAHVEALRRDAGGAWARVEPAPPAGGNDAAARGNADDELPFSARAHV